MFLTVLINGVVTIDGREDLTRDLLMNGYLVSTDPKSDNKRRNSGNNVDALVKMMANVGIANRGSVKDTTQDDHICLAFYIRDLGTIEAWLSTGILVHVAGRFHLQQKKTPTSCIWRKGALSTCIQEERGVPPWCELYASDQTTSRCTGHARHP
jgi:hypothetical protein